jgi:dienelactone hydrolase
VKKTLVVLLLCLISFLAGFVLHFLFPESGLPLKIKAMQRRELRKTLKLERKEFAEAAILEEKDMGSYVKRRLRFHWEGLFFEAFLLIPHGPKGKMAAILALPGHHTSKEEVIGEKTSRWGVDYGLKLVKAGFCVLAPDIPFAEDKKLEDHIALNLILAGSNITSIRLSCLETLISYLFSLDFIDPERFGCIGWSMGGGLALYLSAVDKRVKVVAISSYFGTYRDTVMRLRTSTDNYIPGILRFGEMVDVACLIAPKPLWLELGDQDPEFPVEAFLQEVGVLKKCYAEFEERFTWQVIPGGHRFGGEGIEEWFTKWLFL